MVGIVYMVQSVEMKSNQCKIGMSATDNDKRISSYGSEATVIRKLSCNNPRDTEADLIDQFNSRFLLLKGREYFEGDIEDMIKLFDDRFQSVADVRVLPNIDVDQVCTKMQIMLMNHFTNTPLQTLRKYKVIQMAQTLVNDYFRMNKELYTRLNYFLYHFRYNEKIICANIEFVRFGILAARNRQAGKKIVSVSEETLAHPKDLNNFLKRCRITPHEVFRLKETVEARASLIDDWVDEAVDSKSCLDLLPMEDIQAENNRGNNRTTAMKYVSINDLLDCIIAKDEDRRHIKDYTMTMRRVIGIYHEELVIAQG